MKENFMSGSDRPTTSPRPIAELLYLQHAFDLPDEEVVWQWIVNPYWQVFKGETNLQNESPVDHRTLSRWRKRLGDAGVEELIGRAKRILSQQTKDKDKLYATVHVGSRVPGQGKSAQAVRVRLAGVDHDHTQGRADGECALDAGKSVRWAHAGRGVGAGSDPGRSEAVGRSRVPGHDVPGSKDLPLVFEARDHSDIESDDQAA
jgi:hypothetical protein